MSVIFMLFTLLLQMICNLCIKIEVDGAWFPSVLRLFCAGVLQLTSEELLWFALVLPGGGLVLCCVNTFWNVIPLVSYLKHQVIEHKVLHVSLLKQDMLKSLVFDLCVLLVFIFFPNYLKSTFLKHDHVNYLILFSPSNGHVTHL